MKKPPKFYCIVYVDINWFGQRKMCDHSSIIWPYRFMALFSSALFFLPRSNFTVAATSLGPTPYTTDSVLLTHILSLFLPGMAFKRKQKKEIFSSRKESITRVSTFLWFEHLASASMKRVLEKCQGLKAILILKSSTYDALKKDYYKHLSHIYVEAALQKYFTLIRKRIKTKC